MVLPMPMVLPSLGRRQTDALRMISISGDSIVPLLEHDDTVMLRISSENSAYSSYQRRIDEVHIIGRVVWFARRL